MFNFILGVIILFSIAQCTVKEACMPDAQGNTYKWCNTLFEKEKKN